MPGFPTAAKIIVGTIVAVGVPFGAVLLAAGMDRWSSGRPVRLTAIGLVAAVLGSLVLILAPLRLGPNGEWENILAQDGLRALWMAGLTVFAAAPPLPAGLLGQWGAIAARGAGCVFLTGWMYSLTPTLIGFVYLPSVAALGVATWRSWSPVAHELRQ